VLDDARKKGLGRREAEEGKSLFFFYFFFFFFHYLVY
jgi:hypothetical protein